MPGTIGNPTLQSDTANGAAYSMLLPLATMLASDDGTLVSVSFYAHAAGTLKVKIFRDDGTNYLFIGEDSVAAVNGFNENVALNIPGVLADDLIGWYSATTNASPDRQALTGGRKVHAGDVTTDTLKSSWSAQNYSNRINGIIAIDMSLTGTIAAQSAVTGELSGVTSQEITIYGDTADAFMESVLRFTYADAHDDTEANNVYSADDLRIGQYKGDGYGITRSTPFFDIPLLGTLISGKLKFRCCDKTTIDREFDLVIQNGQPTYPHNPVVVGDYYKDHYAGDGGSINSVDISAGSDFEIDLNATGLGWITQGQMLKLCLRLSHDINNSAPSTGSERVWVRSADYATQTERPRLILFYQPPIELTGTIAGQSALQGALKVAREIAGALAAQAGVSGALKVSRELTGAIESQSSVQAALALSRKISGTIAGQTLVQGILTLGGIEVLTGTIAAQSDISGDLTLGAEEVLTGTIAAQSGVSGQLSRIMKLAGTIAAQSGVAGVLGTAEVYLAGIIAANSAVGGTLAGIWRITGEVAAQAVVEGVLTVPGSGQRQAGMFLVM